jgi:hypothetical protein
LDHNPIDEETKNRINEVFAETPEKDKGKNGVFDSNEE